MFKKAGFSALLSIFFVSLAAAFDLNNASFDLKENFSAFKVPAPPAPAPGAARTKTKEWTIMVFVNGKNNLEPYALKDINEMEMVGSTGKLNIVVEVGRMEGFDDSDGDWRGVRRYLITKDTDTKKVGSPMLADLGKVDMGDYRSLASFGRWAKAAYPAKKYMLIVWNHGSGWTKDGKPLITKGISYDSETKNHINTPQLGLALREMGGVDVYGSDACLMQMPEVDYELKDYADYIVGSEETEPGDGYTYNTFLAPVAANPGMSPVQLARAAVDAYSDHYRQRNEGSTQSIIRTSALPGLVTRVNAWVDAVMADGLKAEVAAARSAAMSYAITDNKDLYHFVSLVAQKTQSAEVKEKSAALMAFIKKDLVVYSRTNNTPGSGGGGGWDYPDEGDDGTDYSESHGIAVFVPRFAEIAGYKDLAWAAASKWDEFLYWYLGV